MDLARLNETACNARRMERLEPIYFFTSVNLRLSNGLQYGQDTLPVQNA
jgi:hypothetical protein